MNTRPELPAPLKSQIDQLLASSGEAFQDGDLPLALSLAHQAWDLIPEPKAGWNYYPQSLAVGFVEDYAGLGDLAEVRRWIPVVYEVYADPDRANHYTLMIEGRALHQLGQVEESRAVFRRVFDLFGPKGFKGEDRRYLDLVQ